LQSASDSGDGKDGAPAPAAKPSAAPDAKSAMAMTAPMQAPGADAGPVTDGPRGENSAGPGAPDPDPSDDLTQIKGLGPKAAEKLNEAGITKASQIAKWSSVDVERYDTLINGRGRIERDDWVGQAKRMAG
jgi:predicted flap endonuclease-1-like 5' DNA nuclease